MIDLKEIKKKINQEWLNAFPELSQYSQNKFYKIVGPIIIGIELVQLPGGISYRPHFVVYSLLSDCIGNDIKSYLSRPIILKEFYNKKGLQFSIPFENHDFFFEEAKDCVRQQFPLPLNGDIHLSEIYALINNYSKSPPLNAAPNSYLQAILQEEKLKIALYVDESEAFKILNEINERDWNSTQFKNWNVDLQTWLKDLQKIITGKQLLLESVNKRKNDKKVNQLKKSFLVQ